MYESGNPNSQQTDTSTEYQTPHVLTHRQLLNNENTWTQGWVSHTDICCGGQGRDSRGWGGCEGITWGEMPDIGDGGMEAANHIAMYVPMEGSSMSYTCTTEPNVQFKKKEKK